MTLSQKKFDKDEALAKYKKTHPSFAKRQRRREPLKITPELLKTVIELYPDLDNLIIAETLDIEYQDLSIITSRLRKEGIKLEKRARPTRYSQFDDAFKKLKDKK